MTPYTFTRLDSRYGVAHNTRGSISNRRTLLFTGQRIIPSKMLAEQLRLVPGAHVAITMDEDNPSKIYIRRADDPDDNEKTQTARVSLYNKQKGILIFCSTPVVNHVLSVTEADISATLYVSPNATEIGGKKYYRIIVEQPFAIK